MRRVTELCSSTENNKYEDTVITRDQDRFSCPSARISFMQHPL